MSRSGYSDDMDDQWAHIMWRGAVASALNGKRGQAFLKEMLAAMDAMPEKRLVANDLETAEGAVCAIGTVGKARGIDMKDIDPEDSSTVAARFGIAQSMAQEIVFMNDEGYYYAEAPEARFARMRRWVASQIREPAVAP